MDRLGAQCPVPSMRCRAMFRNFLQNLSRGSGRAPWRPWRGCWPPVTSLHPWPDPGPGPASHRPVASGQWSPPSAGQGHGGKRQNVETWRCRAECSVLPNTRMGARTSLSGTIIYNQLHWNGRWWDKIFLRVPVTSKKMKKILLISNEDSLLDTIPFSHLAM